MSLLILHGSQTGFSIEVAERIKREARQRHFQVVMQSMQDFPPVELPTHSLIVFVCSTTGQGVEPDSMKKFWRFLLRRDLSTDSLLNTSFGVFGLGDSSYAKFNFAAKKLYKRLLQLGGKAIVPRGDGDDQHDLGVDGALDPWLEEWWKAVFVLFPLAPGLEIIPPSTLPLNTYNVNFIESDDTPEIINTYDLLGDYEGTVSCNKHLTPETHFQEVRHIEVEVPKNATYNAGDILLIYPRNDPQKVQQVLDYLKWGYIADKPLAFSINPEVTGETLPQYLSKSPITLRSLFEKHLNIFGRPRRYFFQLLAHFATDLQHAEKLREFASAQGQNELYLYCHKMKRTTFEILQDFSSVIIPLKYLLDIISPMAPRYFSISSAPGLHQSIHLTVAIVNYRTKLKSPRVGVCTDWMSRWTENTKIRFSLKKGTLKLPKTPDVPIICIGPGTGVAPMRALLLQRSLGLTNGKLENCLIFGCRSRTADFFYEKEWKEVPGLHVITAFSRDQEEKIYVQDRIKENGEILWSLIHERGAFIYISGNAKRMPEDVSAAFKAIMKEYGNLEQENDQESYLKYLIKEGRYQEECWS